MNCLPLIEAKRDGRELSEEQIQSIIRGYTLGQIPDYQMAALLMAILFRGMDIGETRALTVALRDSGRHLEFPSDPRPIVDKHSTGGVGDKVSLVLAPLLACLGFRVPMISGRGLGITGGTLDKLEAIPGFRTALTPREIVDQVQRIGCAICGQTEEMAPADKALYALRDVTGTVPSLPLITASILSKKLAENLNCLLLDVKFGPAAFMGTEEQARELATMMVHLGTECGVNTHALITDMSQPLGRAAGNLLEVREALDCLEGRGPADLNELVVECAAHLLVQAGQIERLEEARFHARKTLHSREAVAKWEEMVVAQGVAPGNYREHITRDSAPSIGEVRADGSGFVLACDARLIGEVVRDIGGGRLRKDTKIDPAVGVDQIRKAGESVKPGSVLCRVHARNKDDEQRAAERLKGAFVLAEKPAERPPLICGIVE